MSRRPVNALAILLVGIVFGVLIWRALRPPATPTLEQRLGVLLKELREARSIQTEQEIRQIGTNALPMLFALAQVTNSPSREFLLSLSQRQSALAFDFQNASEAHELAAIGFHVLGPLAEGAVSALTNALNHPNPELQKTAILCLGGIGPGARDAVPFLIAEITNADRLVRAYAKSALANIHSQPSIAVPALVDNLSQRDGNTHLTVAALGKFGSDAKAALPALLPLLNDPNSHIRFFTSNSLKEIDPQAAIQAGVK
jgi:HEAT repeat protein